MISTPNHKLRLTTLAAALAVPLVVGSHQAAAAERMLEEIIVTAQKRSESVQDIPSTVNVLDGDALKDFGVLKFTDLGALTAGLEINSFTGRSGRMTMRGIDFNPISAAEASVTTYWNQAVVDSNVVFQQMFDIQRIEVLRGPQGTLAGRTSPAGAINIHTVRPNLESMEGDVRGTITDNDGINTQVAASFPLIPGKLAIRVAGVFDESDLDEVKNDLNGDVTGEETTAGRISLSWLPTENLGVDLAVQYLEREFKDILVLAGTPVGDPVLDPGGVLRELDAYDRRGVGVGVEGAFDDTDADFLTSSLVLEWELDSHTLTSVTGYQKTESTWEYDNGRGSANPDNVARRIAADDRTDWSQELRIANNDSETWEYMLGAYFEDSDVLFTQDQYLPAISPLSPSSGLLTYPVEVERWGLFTHNKFYLTDAWSLQLGLRYQEVEQVRDMFLVAGPSGFSFFAPGDFLRQVLSDENKKYSEDSTTGQVTLQYQINEDSLVYGLVGTGWRPGAITVTGTVLPQEVLLFDSEDSMSYELGFKSSLMGGAMRLNGSLYYQDFDDYISRLGALNVRGLDGAIETSGLTVNGDAEVWGAELDLTAILSDNWFLGGTLSYSKGEFADGTTHPCNEFDDNGAAIIPDGQFVLRCDVGGDSIGTAPDWTASINSEYSIPFGSVEGYGRILYTYTGERFNSQLGDLDPYQVVNLHLGVRGEQWNVELFARNLFDEEALRGGTVAAAQVRRRPTGYGTRYVVPGRRIGVTASYRW
jgi:iron complex outermembrane receptor protein